MLRRTLTFLAATTLVSASALVALPASAVEPGPDVRLTSHADNAVVSGASLRLSGTFSRGMSIEAPPSSIMLMVDVSAPANPEPARDCTGDAAITAADDLNGDGEAGTGLDCRIASVIAFTTGLHHAPDVRIGLVAFSQNQAFPGDLGEPLVRPEATDASGANRIESAARALQTQANSATEDANGLTQAAQIVVDQYAGVSGQKWVYVLTNGDVPPVQDARTLLRSARTYVYAMVPQGGCREEKPIYGLAGREFCAVVTDPTKVAWSHLMARLGFAGLFVELLNPDGTSNRDISPIGVNAQGQWWTSELRNLPPGNYTLVLAVTTSRPDEWMVVQPRADQRIERRYTVIVRQESSTPTPAPSNTPTPASSKTGRPPYAGKPPHAGRPPHAGQPCASWKRGKDQACSRRHSDRDSDRNCLPVRAHCRVSPSRGA